MLLYRGVKPEFIARLRVGDLFEDSIITDIVKKSNYLSIITATGDVYNVHHKPYGYNIFLQRKELREMRQKREKAKKGGAKPGE
jgi:hypothetical protein